MTGTQSDENRFIVQLTEVITANLTNDQFGVNELAREMRLSRSYIHRRLKMLGSQSISHFIRNVRLDKAMEMIRETNDSVAEVAYRVGFGSPAYFNHCFHDRFGFPPGGARKRPLNETESLIPLQDPENTRSGFTHAQKAGWIHKNRKLFFTVSGVILIGVSLSMIYSGFIAESFPNKENIPDADKSVILLPFKNLSSDAANQYFADGIAEDILNHLSKIEELRVISRTSSEKFRGRKLSAAQISRKSNVNYLLEGSVRRENEKIRVSVQFIDAKSDRHLWSKNYDRQMTDIFAIQSDIARNVADELQFVLSEANMHQIEKIPAKNTEAYNYYLMGRFFCNKRTEEGLKKSVEYFEKAIANDPDYAKAYAGLADACFIQTYWTWGNRPEGFENAKQIAIRALELDNNLAEAYATLGSILCYSDWNWEESRDMLRKAIQLNPDYAIARQYYSELLEILNEKEEALEQIEIAIGIDPLFFMHRILKSAYYYHEGKYDDALEALLKSEEFYPGYSLRGFNYFLIYYRLGNEFKAIEALKEILTHDTSTIIFIDTIKTVYSNSGMKGILYWIIDLEQQNISPNFLRIANWYCLVDEKELALNWLERAMEERAPDLPRINCIPDFNLVRDEPRFIALIEKMGLTPRSDRTAN